MSVHYCTSDTSTQDSPPQNSKSTPSTTSPSQFEWISYEKSTSLEGRKRVRSQASRVGQRHKTSTSRSAKAAKHVHVHGARTVHESNNGALGSPLRITGAQIVPLVEEEEYDEAIPASETGGSRSHDRAPDFPYAVASLTSPQTVAGDQDIDPFKTYPIQPSGDDHVLVKYCELLCPFPWTRVILPFRRGATS